MKLTDIFKNDRIVEDIVGIVIKLCETKAQFTKANIVKNTCEAFFWLMEKNDSTYEVKANFVQNCPSIQSGKKLDLTMAVNCKATSSWLIGDSIEVIESESH